MSKKEIKLIVAILFVALGIYVGVQIYNRLNVKTYGIVTYKNQVIHTFNVNKDEDYYFNGSYGKMKLEVKDGKWRITEEECPNHICSSIGWVSVKDYFPIVCIPNEVIDTLKDN